MTTTEEISITNIIISLKTRGLCFRKMFLDLFSAFDQTKNPFKNNIYCEEILPSKRNSVYNVGGIFQPEIYEFWIKPNPHSDYGELGKMVRFIEYEIPNLDDIVMLEHIFNKLDEQKRDINNIIYIIDTGQCRVNNKDLLFLDSLVIKYGESIFNNLIILHMGCNNIYQTPIYFEIDDEQLKKIEKAKKQFYESRYNQRESEVTRTILSSIELYRSIKSIDYKDKYSNLKKFINNIIYMKFGSAIYAINNGRLIIHTPPIASYDKWISTFSRYILKEKDVKVNLNNLRKEMNSKLKEEKINKKTIENIKKAIINVQKTWEIKKEEYKRVEALRTIQSFIPLVMGVITASTCKNYKFTDIFTDQETNMTNGLNNLLQHEINSLTEYGEPAIKWWINEFSNEIKMINLKSGKIDITNPQ